MFSVEKFPPEVLDFLLVLRCLRIVKIVGTFKRFRVILMTFLNIGPSLAIYGIVLLVSSIPVSNNVNAYQTPITQVENIC